MCRSVWKSKSRRRSYAFIFTAICVFLFVCVVNQADVCQADELKPSEPAAEPKKNWTEEVKESAERFEVYPSADAEEPLEMIAAYKWSNAARPNVLGNRLCLLYLHGGRPVASCKVYPTGSSIVHTFISFADPPLVAEQSELVVWTPPPKSAPEFTRLTDADPPHKLAARRRIQMKSLVRDFTAETGPGEARRQSTVPELRLLPKPLYRYKIKDGGQDGVVDGALYCFVANGGNPQVLLLIEAIRKGDSMDWQYGFSRRTLAQLKAFHKEREVWSVAFVRGREMMSISGFHRIELPATE